MKKIIVLIMTITIAEVVPADIIDGDFTGTGFVGVELSLDSSQTGDGWYVCRSDAWTYDTANDEVTRGTWTSSRGFGQIFTSSRTGNQTITVDWEMVDDNDDSDNRVSYRVWGINNGTGSGLATFDIGTWILDATADVGSTVTELARWNRHNVTGSEKTDDIEIAVDFGIGYDAFAFGFSTFPMNVGDSVTVANVVIPEPTVVELILFASMSMLVGRRLTKKFGGNSGSGPSIAIF